MIIQGTVFTAVVFHFMINDESGWIGTGLRSLCGCGQPSEREVRAFLALLWVIAAVGQVLFLLHRPSVHPLRCVTFPFLLNTFIGISWTEF